MCALRSLDLVHTVFASRKKDPVGAHAGKRSGSCRNLLFHRYLALVFAPLVSSPVLVSALGNHRYLSSQVRPVNRSTSLNERDVNELVEMILGALGKDAIGMGSGIAHPRESEEWKGMTFRQRMEFFAPVWRCVSGPGQSQAL